MFISESEARDRLASSRNILNIADRATEHDNVDLPLFSEVPSFSPHPSKDPDPEDPETPSESEEEKLDAAVLRDLFPAENKRGKKGLDDETHAMIGTVSRMPLVTQASTALAFDVSKSFVSAVERAATSPNAASAGKQKPGLEQRIRNLQNKTRKRAFDKLLLSLGVIDDEKIKGIKSAKEASQVASNLSRVVSATTPKEDAQSKNVHFHVMVPPRASLDRYGVIDVASEETANDGPAAH